MKFQSLSKLLIHYIPELRQTGNQLLGICPFHHDTKPSLNINTSTGEWHCFGCGEGGRMRSLVEKLTGDYILASSLTNDMKFEEPLEPTIAEIVLPKDNGWSDYLLNRGFNRRILEKFGVYYNITRGAIFPVYDEKNSLVGWIERDMRGNYKYSRGLPKKRILYNLNYLFMVAKEVYVCEGALDVIWLYQAGYTNAVATLGACVSMEQIALLKRCFNKITVIPDADEAGVRMASKLKLFLGDDIVTVISLPKDNTDIQDYSEQQVKALLSGGDNEE